MLTRTVPASAVRFGKWDTSTTPAVRRGDVRLSADVCIEIDLENILSDLATAALANRSGRARMLGGRLRARVIGLPRTEPFPDYTPNTL